MWWQSINSKSVISSLELRIVQANFSKNDEDLEITQALGPIHKNIECFETHPLIKVFVM